MGQVNNLPQCIVSYPNADPQTPMDPAPQVQMDPAPQTPMDPDTHAATGRAADPTLRHADAPADPYTG